MHFNNLRLKKWCFIRFENKQFDLAARCPNWRKNTNSFGNNNEPVHEISNNVVCATSKASDQPAHTRSLIKDCLSLEYSMIVKLLTEHHLEFLSLKWGCRGSSESAYVKMPHCWKSHVLAQSSFINTTSRRVSWRQPTFFKQSLHVHCVR